MEENIINHAKGVIVINGGNPLPGCPKDWDEAIEIQRKLNEGKDWEPGDFESQPVWRFDCGYKLDFDGPLMDVSSRFYPPKTHYGGTWDGSVTIRILNQEVAIKKFDCQTLEELKAQAEEYVNSFVLKIKAAFL